MRAAYRFGFSTLVILVILSGIPYVSANGIEMAQYSFVLEPEEDSVDVDFTLSPNESVLVTVIFNDTSISGMHDVWPMTNYHYPTKTVSECPLRFEHVYNVTFLFGWENVTLSPLFLTGFTIRIFYSGSSAVMVNVTLTYPEGILPPQSPSGWQSLLLGVVTVGGISVIVIMLLVIRNRRTKH